MWGLADLLGCCYEVNCSMEEPCVPVLVNVGAESSWDHPKHRELVNVGAGYEGLECVVFLLFEVWQAEGAVTRLMRILGFWSCV